MNKIIYFLLIFFYIKSLSQELLLSARLDERQWYDYTLKKNNLNYPIAFYPFLFSDTTTDSLILNSYFNVSYNRQKSIKSLFTNSFIQISENDFKLHINPLLFLKTSFDSLYQNTRGVFISGQFEKQFRFVTSVIETQAFFPEYLVDYVKRNSVAPGGGRARIFKKKGYDYSLSSGYIVYSPLNSLQILLGHTRQFVGYGYRSLLLSDAVYDYPLLRVAYVRKKWQYSFSYAIFQNTTPFDDRTQVYSRRYSAQHFFNISLFKNFELGIFEHTVFNSMSLQRTRPPEEFFIPLLFAHTSIYGLDNKNNVLVGSLAQYSLTKNLQCYGQYVLDKKNTYAWQVGLKINEPFRIQNMFILCEYNRSLSSMYAGTTLQNSFVHQNEPVSHPFGNHFRELVGIFRYEKSRFYVFFEIQRANYANNYKRLFLPDDINQVNVSQLPLLNQIIAEIGYTLNSQSRLRLAAGIQHRDIQNEPILNYFYVSLYTGLFNQYHDF